MKNISRIVRSNLKLKHLQLLLAVDKFRSLGKAAQFMSLTQSAVSKNLAEIESMFDIVLFDRSAAGTQPTTHGQTLLNLARTVLDAFEQTLEEIEAQRHAHSIRLVIGITSLISPLLMAKTIALAKTSSPDSMVRLEEGDLRNLMPRLRSGELDMLISPIEPDYMAVDLKAESLYSERFQLVVSDEHPLLATDNLNWKSLTDYPWVIPPLPSTMHAKLREIFSVNDATPPKDMMEASSPLSVLSLIQHRLAIAVWCSQIAALHAQRGLIKVLPFKLSFRPLPIGIISLKEKRHNTLAINFMNHLKSAV